MTGGVPPAVGNPARSLRARGAVSIAIAAAAAAVLPVFLTGALSVQLRAALHLSAADIGLEVAAFFGTSAICSAGFGAVAERIGAVTVMRAAALAALTGMMAIALLARSLLSLAAGLVIGGVANGAMQPAVNLFLSRSVHTGRQGLAFGVKQAGIPTATLLSGLAVPALALTVGWRVGFLVGAGVAAGVAATLGVVGRRPAGPQAGVAGGQRAEAPASTERWEPRPGTREAGPMSPAARQAGRPASAAAVDLVPLVVMAGGMAAAVAASNSLGAFVVPSAVAHGVGAGLAGLLSALGSVAGLSARVGFGWQADRMSRRGVAAAQRDLAVTSTLLGAGIVGYLALASGIRLLLVPGVLVAFGAGWGFNGLFNLAVVRAYPHAPARATGITQVGTYLGGMSGPLVFGLLVDRAGYSAAWVMCAVLAAVGATTLVAAAGLLGRRRALQPGQPDRAALPPALLIGGLCQGERAEHGDEVHPFRHKDEDSK